MNICALLSPVSSLSPASHRFLPSRTSSEILEIPSNAAIALTETCRKRESRDLGEREANFFLKTRARAISRRAFAE